MGDPTERGATKQIFGLLRASGHPHTWQHHAPIVSSLHAAELRGASLAIGGKSLLFKIGKQPDFRLMVLSAARLTDNRLIRKHFGVQKLRFARPEELLAHTGLRPGCVPPFGRPVFDVPLYVDQELAEKAEIAFTPADHCISVRMAMAHYLEVSAPVDVFAFSRPPPA